MIEKSWTHQVVDRNNHSILDMIRGKTICEDYIKSMFADDLKNAVVYPLSKDGLMILKGEVRKALPNSKIWKVVRPDDIYIEDDHLDACTHFIN